MEQLFHFHLPTSNNNSTNKSIYNSAHLLDTPSQLEDWISAEQKELWKYHTSFFVFFSSSFLCIKLEKEVKILYTLAYMKV